MDMSFSLSNATPLPRPLDYAALVAAVRDGNGDLAPDPSAIPDVVTRRLLALHPHLCLAEVVLARADWRAAARHLGGRFIAAQA